MRYGTSQTLTLMFNTSSVFYYGGFFDSGLTRQRRLYQFHGVGGSFSHRDSFSDGAITAAARCIAVVIYIFWRRPYCFYDRRPAILFHYWHQRRNCSPADGCRHAACGSQRLKTSGSRHLLPGFSLTFFIVLFIIWWARCEISSPLHELFFHRWHSPLISHWLLQGWVEKSSGRRSWHIWFFHDPMPSSWSQGIINLSYQFPSSNGLVVYKVCFILPYPWFRFNNLHAPFASPPDRS